MGGVAAGTAEALEWDAGDRSEVSWYGEGAGPRHDGFRASTGIQKPRTEYPPLEGPPRLFELAERARPLFDDLAKHALLPTQTDQKGS